MKNTAIIYEPSLSLIKARINSLKASILTDLKVLVLTDDRYFKDNTTIYSNLTFKYLYQIVESNANKIYNDLMKDFDVIIIENIKMMSKCLMENPTVKANKIKNIFENYEDKLFITYSTNIGITEKIDERMIIKEFYKDRI